MTGRSKLGILLLLAFCALGPVGPAFAADRSETVRTDGQVRSFSTHVPDGAPPRGGFPVVLAFHGGGMQGADMQRITGLDAVAEAHRFIVVYPDGVNRHWNDGRSTIRNPQNDIRFVSALLDQIERSYPVNPSRIFVTGISNGALFTERLGCELAERIAGIAPVAGSMPAEKLPTCQPARSVAVLQIDGTADPIMPYHGGAVKDFGGKGEGGLVSSVPQTVNFWAKNNGCDVAGAREPMPPVQPLDRTRMVRTRFSACPQSAPVTLMTIIGGGHAWPGGAQVSRPLVIGQISSQLNASEAIASFFLALPTRR